MKILEKLTSKKGQVSMEIGILVAAAVAVAAIAAYYYVTNVKTASENAGADAGKAVTALTNQSGNAVTSLQKL